ncbi:MAG: MBL fold hydrolase, partial [Planctomycetes bacterium RBG_13_63_9]
ELDALLLTHAHVDHCGLTPKLVREGFHGPIITTSASADLVELVLRDSAHIQAEEAAYKKKRHREEGRKGKHPEKPLYSLNDVEQTLPLLKPVSYRQVVEITPHASVVFHDAGHILGSAMIELRVQTPGGPRTLVFSGDLGQAGKPIVCNPAVLTKANHIVMESTYGDRNHEDHGNVESQLADVINRTADRGGNVVIPIFAIERSQELIYYLSRLSRARRIPSLPAFLDSPMAVDATGIFRRHRECFDAETWMRINSGDSPLSYPELTMVRTSEDSKAINRQKGPVIIMSTSGMCTAGRIKFHLRQNLGRPESTILFVGYQAQGTLGRLIRDGKQEVRIHGHNLWVKAQVDEIHGFSGHADRDALLRWLGHFNSPPQNLFLTHGEEDSAQNLAAHVRNELGWKVTVPEYQQVVEID